VTCEKGRQKEVERGRGKEGENDVHCSVESRINSTTRSVHICDASQRL